MVCTLDLVLGETPAPSNHAHLHLLCEARQIAPIAADGGVA